MAAKLELRAKGLFTWPNPLVEVPDGGMALAKNVVIDRESTVEPRRGYSELDYPLGTNPLNRANQFITYGPDDFIAHYGLQNAPNKLAFFSRIVESTGTIVTGSNVISNLPDLFGLYVDQVVKSIPRETIFLGNQTLGSNTITQILSSQGIFTGMAIGGQGIPVGTTVTSVSGVGPFTITISNNALFTQDGNTLTVTDANLSGIPANTRVTSINVGNITVSNNLTSTSRTLTFLPAAVNTATDTITINNHGLVDGDSVQFSSTGTLPGGLSSTGIYYVVLSNSLSFKVSISFGGNPVNITTQGTGVHTLKVREDFTSAGWIDYPGIFLKPDSNVKMRYGEAAGGLYFTTDVGIKVLDNIEGITFIGDVTFGSDIVTNVDVLDVTIGEFVRGTGIPDGTQVIDLLSPSSFQISTPATITAVNQKIFVQPRLAGIARALDGQAFLTTDTTGFLTADKTVSYKIVWSYINFNNKTFRGAPSSEINVQNNTTEAKNTELQFTVPGEITPAFTYQVYRTGFSANAQSAPPQDYALIFEASPTYSEVINKLVIFNDNVPESLRTGAALYTNEAQEGPLLANFPPPFATDLAQFKGSLFLSNTMTKHNLTLLINSVSGQFSILGDLTNLTAFKAMTVRSPSLSITADTTSGSDIITNISTIDMSATAVGQGISGPGIPTGTKIAAFESASSLRLTKAATATAAAQTLALQIVGVQVGQTVLNANIPSGTVVTDIFTPVSMTGNTTIGSPLITGIVSTAGLKVGQPVNGTGIAASALILTVDGPTQITMTDNAANLLTGAVFNFEAGARISQPATAIVTGTTITLKNGSGGIEAGDTITIAGVTYTASTNEDYSGSNRIFKVYAQGSPAQNISDTAQSLIRVINRQESAAGTPPIYAFYTSTVSTLPGEINFSARTLNTPQFFAWADSTASGQAWTPNIPGPGVETVGSKNDELINGLSWSKTDQPEAFPLGYNNPEGSQKEAIIRSISLRDSLFVLKNDGVFRITGESPDTFSSVIFDNTIKLAAPESAVSLSNTIFCLSTEGVVSISDSNIQVMSRPIEDLILDVFEASQTKVRTLSFGIPYTSDRKYILFTIKNAEDEAPTQAFVYNSFTNTWTTWEMNRSCGGVSSGEDLLYLGRSDKDTFKVERKDRRYTDYLEDTFNVTILGTTGVLTSGDPQVTLVLPSTTHFEVGQTISGDGIPPDTTIANIDNNFTITMSKAATMSSTVQLFVNDNQVLRLADTNGIQVGDVLFQNSGRFAIITVVNNQKSTITTRIPINSWTLGTATVLVAIETEMKYVPQTCGAPAAIKQVTEFIGLFQTPAFDTITVSFDTDLSGGQESVPLVGQIGGLLWGLYPWGGVIWGGVVKPIPLRTLIPLNKQRNTQLNIQISHREAFAFYRLSGIEVYHNAGLQRVRR